MEIVKISEKDEIELYPTIFKNVRCKKNLNIELNEIFKVII